MNVIRTAFPGLLILEPAVYGDQRGYFFESWNDREFREKVSDTVFVQDNESFSRRGVVRGLHFQKGEHCQSKLVRCAVGAVLDIVVDMRHGSPTYGKVFQIELNDQNHLQLYIPKGFAHGFAVLSDTAVFQYKCDSYYCPSSEGGINIRSKSLGIKLPLREDECVYSAKDLVHPDWHDAKETINFVF